MKDYRFYIDFQDRTRKRKRLSPNNCIAVCINCKWIDKGEVMMECLAPVATEPIANTNFLGHSAISQSYISENCVRISENKARQIHPNLFNYL